MSKILDILVIDDEQVVRDGLRRVCEAEGLTIETVGDAASGLEKLRKTQYRLVVCDVMLPDQDGFQVLATMQAEGLTTPLIMITGCSTMQNAVKAIRQGAVDFIPKPFTVDELESCIRRGLRLRELMGEEISQQGVEDAFARLAGPCPPDYHRFGNLSWVHIEPNGIGLVGVTELYLKTISAVKDIALVPVDEDFVQAAPCGTLTAEDGLVHSILSPMSGKVVARNEEVLSNPALLAHYPYSEGWLYRIVPVNVAYESQSLITCTQDN